MALDDADVVRLAAVLDARQLPGAFPESLQDALDASPMRYDQCESVALQQVAFDTVGRLLEAAQASAFPAQRAFFNQQAQALCRAGAAGAPQLRAQFPQLLSKVTVWPGTATSLPSHEDAVQPEVPVESPDQKRCTACPVHCPVVPRRPRLCPTCGHRGHDPVACPLREAVPFTPQSLRDLTR